MTGSSERRPGHRALRAGRESVEGEWYAVTACGAGVDLTWAAPSIIATARGLDAEGAIELHCVVVMPDHCHLMLTLGEGRELSEVMRLFKGRGLTRQIDSLSRARDALKEKLTELKELHVKIGSEPIPEPEGLSQESRRMINGAVIALAQHLVLQFSEHSLASLSKASMDKAVGDMQFGDRRDCDRLVERIRERITRLSNEKHLPALVQRRANSLGGEIKFRNEADTVPLADSVDEPQQQGMCRRGHLSVVEAIQLI